MSLNPKNAQMFVEVEDTHAAEAPAHVHLDDDVVVYDEKPTEEQVIEVHEQHDAPEAVAVFTIRDVKLPSIPGAPETDDLEVQDAEVEISEDSPKKTDPWDPDSYPSFEAFVKNRLDNIPKHSGKKPGGCERAKAYLETLQDVISKTMRADLDGNLNADDVAACQDEIQMGIEALNKRLDGFKRKKKAGIEYPIVKEGQKAPHVGGIIVTVPILLSRIARVCINGSVSAGHDIEDLFERQVKKYALDTREQAEVMQLLADMGYPLKRDRGFLINDETDPTSSDNMDHSANYSA